METKATLQGVRLSAQKGRLAADLVRACAAAGPVGLCSGALRSDIDPVLAALGIAACFAVRVTADDVEASKPDPASYRLCVARLAAMFPERGIAPARCVAIEDTTDGIASARGAGIPVLAVATNLPAAALLRRGRPARSKRWRGFRRNNWPRAPAGGNRRGERPRGAP